ncbi:hypothetical protein G5C60_45445 [Streptomyces sp. HC44]|uniref:PH domain-containing protein n=1 Tax=Streptomyces scabichelini TaxID=2711217 RepID=A0A6G4VKE6_9ACTN|nr:hypothetical protein [Streptomyces scabichelini]NGO14648.1 hypothetical protein [Streptomyces scabichelini]
MSYDEPLRLPAAAIPDGCREWTAGQAGGWSLALPPRWTFLRVRGSVAAGVTTLALCAGGWAAALGGLWPPLAAAFAVYVLWVLSRPELVWAGAPAMLIALAVQAPSQPWVVTAVFMLVVVSSWAVVAVRLRARSPQFERALEATEGVTARLPDADEPVRRGSFLRTLGLGVLVLGVLTAATSGLWDSADDRRGAWVVAFFVAGLGVTALASAWFARRGAVGLRRAPAPVLRVLVRDDAQGSTEVYAADDLRAARPLFTVDLTSFDGEDDDEGEEGEDPDEDDEEKIERLLEVVDADTPGPIREAVLYGAPFDGAEVLVVSADVDPDQPPLTEWSSGPVRPLSLSAGRRRIERERAREAQSRQLEEQARKLAEAQDPVAVRRWRAGWLDWVSAVLLVAWVNWICWAWFTESGAPLWELALGVVLGLYGTVRVPTKLAWRITADRTGLWITGLLGPRHVSWESLRSVRRQRFQLQLRWRGDDWAVAAPQWGWFERSRGLVHPYDALAAELSAMRTHPALRPTGESTGPERGRPLWPLAVVLALAWVVAVLALR